MYCDRGQGNKVWAVSRHSQGRACDTALGHPATWRLRPRHGRGHDLDTAAAACDMARARACVRWLGQVGCSVHLTQFDPVFGLSTVSESLFGHCSSQNFFEFFLLNKIKSNKMGQNFGKMKFSKIKFLWIKKK